MVKRIVLSGVLGGVVLMATAGVANVVFGFRTYIDLRTVPDERHVYGVLKQSVKTPGAYMFNPAVGANGFPGQEPVFLVRYSGMGHDFAGIGMLLELGVAVISALIAASMLWLFSSRVSTYGWRLVFFVLVGLLFAVWSDMGSVGILGNSVSSALLLAGHQIVSWTLAGSVMAALMRQPVA